MCKIGDLVTLKTGECLELRVKSVTKEGFECLNLLTGKQMVFKYEEIILLKQTDPFTDPIPQIEGLTSTLNSINKRYSNLKDSEIIEELIIRLSEFERKEDQNNTWEGKYW